MSDILNVFLRKKPVLLLLTMDQKINYASLLAKKVNLTYTHAVLILRKFEENKLIESRMDGRKRVMILTKRGLDIQDIFKKTYNLLKGGETVGKK